MSETVSAAIRSSETVRKRVPDWRTIQQKPVGQMCWAHSTVSQEDGGRWSVDAVIEVHQLQQSQAAQIVRHEATLSQFSSLWNKCDMTSVRLVGTAENMSSNLERKTTRQKWENQRRYSVPSTSRKYHTANKSTGHDSTCLSPDKQNDTKNMTPSHDATNKANSITRHQMM